MIINNIRLKNFRCFDDSKFNFSKRFVVIEGDNGSGKTSLLEALYYACYLKSFRTRKNNELVLFDQEYFFIHVDFDDFSEINNQIQAGFSQADGKLVKLNDKQIQSYKEIISLYKVINITENDLSIINGAPEERRFFLNQSLFLLNPDFVFKLRKYKQILEQRNAFLFKNIGRDFSVISQRELLTWTNQLWDISFEIQKERISFLNKIQNIVNKLLADYFEEFQVDFHYNPKSLKLDYHNLDSNKNFEEFWKTYKDDLSQKELRWGRSFFGMHVDDFSISFRKKKARFYASRGQQKLILLLLKVAQLLVLEGKIENACLLIDDFLTDFDFTKIEKFFSLFNNLKCQIFVTTPLTSFFDFNQLKVDDFQFIKLT